MRRDDGEILKMFQFELRYLEDGGYRHSPRTPWRIPYVFEDSPTRLNFCDATQPHRCIDCLLMEFVPLQFRGETAPCRFVPPTEAGESVDYFYRTGTQMELEEALACWLHRQIELMPRAQTNANRPRAADQEDERRRWRRLENSVCSKSDLGGKL